MLHVDLVEDRWSAGLQERVGIVYVDHGRLVVESERPHYLVIVREGAAGVPPAEALSELSRRFHGDYFFATVPHTESECPFAQGRTPLRPRSDQVNPTFSIWVTYIYATIHHGGGAPDTPYCAVYGFTSQADAQAFGEARKADHQISTNDDPIMVAAVVELDFMVLPLLGAA